MRIQDASTADVSVVEASVADASAADSADATTGADAAVDSGPAADAAVHDAAPKMDCDAGEGPVGNIIQNGGFECGLTPWYAWSGLINTTTTIAHSGTSSIIASDRQQTYLGPVQDLTAVMVAGQNYGGSAWATVGMLDDGGAPSPQTVNMTLKFECQGDTQATYLQVGSVTGVLPGTWTEVGGTFALPSTCVAAAGTKVELYVEGPDIDINLYVDDVVVQ